MFYKLFRGLLQIFLDVYIIFEMFKLRKEAFGVYSRFYLVKQD